MPLNRDIGKRLQKTHVLATFPLIESTNIPIGHVNKPSAKKQYPGNYNYICRRYNKNNMTLAYNRKLDAAAGLKRERQ